MRARSPTVRVEGQQLVVRTELEASDGSEMAPLEVTLPGAFADLLDPTATPAAPALATLAAARGEDLVIEGTVGAEQARCAIDLATTLAGWWHTGPVRVEIEDTHDATVPTSGVGLFFSRGVDSWSTLLDRLDADGDDGVTHLLSVHHGNTFDRPAEVGIIDGHRRVADELGLTLVVMSTTARTLLDPIRTWLDVNAAVVYSAGLVAGGGLRRLVFSSADPAVFTGKGPDDLTSLDGLVHVGSPVVIANVERWRHERVAHLAANTLARSTLQVCWEGKTSGNCGRCFKCQMTLGALALAGDPDPSRGFDHGPDPELVRGLSLKPYWAAMVTPLVDGLPPEHEDLRRAWADAWSAALGNEPPERWGDSGPPGMAGPGIAKRVATAVRTRTGSAEAVADRPLGWRAGSVPLRPPLDAHASIRGLASGAAARPRPWAIVEPHTRDGQRDGRQADLALACTARWGAGTCYIPGILWAPEQPPVLDPTAVARMLRQARARLWWRDEGDLDALRLVESIEQGCLPIQVMPQAAAHDLARSVPSPLTAAVCGEGDLGELDLSPEGVAAALGPVVDHVLAGVPERDLLIGSTSA